MIKQKNVTISLESKPRNAILFGTAVELIKNIGLSAMAGLLMGLAWQESIASFLGIVALGVFFFIQLTVRQFWMSMVSSMVVGVTAFAVACFWLQHTVEFLAGTEKWLSGLLFVTVCCYQSIVFLLFSITWHFVRKLKLGFVCLPAIWFVCEQVFPTLFPFHFGYLLADYPWLCQLAEVGGAPFVSLFAATMATFLALVACLSVECIKQKWIKRQKLLPWKQASPIGRAQILAVAGYGAIVLTAVFWSHFRFSEVSHAIRRSETTSRGQKLMVVQCHTQDPASNYRMLKASKQVEGKADLVIWPECAIGNYSQSLTDFSIDKEVKTNSRGLKVRRAPFPGISMALLAGGDSYRQSDEKAKGFVSAFLFDQKQRCIGRHDKIELMPGGEYIPGESWVPSFRKWWGGDRVVLRGEEMDIVGNVNGAKIGALLCCEDMYPYLSQKLCQRDADILVCLGNGMAFNSEIALRQHFRIARMRSIEGRKYFVRCASRGVSAVISPAGTVVNQIPCMEDGAMLVKIPKVPLPSSPFTHSGSFWPWLIVIGLGLGTTSASFKPIAERLQFKASVVSASANEGVKTEGVKKEALT